MSYQKQQFGMMDEGYFVPKGEILAWINALLQVNISKIEALGSGSIYCQILDVIHPGKITLSKVNWKAKNDTEFLNNFRLLQSGFEKAGIKRYIEVQKLVKAKYQDNLEFIQWFKRYFDVNCGNKGEGYDAVEKRNKVVPDFSFAEKVVVPKMYNSSGQVILKEKLTSPTKKKQEIPPRVKSPKPVVTPSTNTRVVKTPVEKKQQPKKVIPSTQVKKTPEQPKKSTSTHQLPKPQQSPQTKQLQLKLKDYEQKLQMVKEIIISEDGSDMKIQLIRELLGIPKPKVQETENNSVQYEQSSPKHEEESQQAEHTENNEEIITQTEEPLMQQASEENQFTESQLEEKPASVVTQSLHQDDAF